MDKLSLIAAILGMEKDNNSGLEMRKNNTSSFLQIGKVYAFGTVTMIYTGRLMDVSDTEYLVDEAAWIPDTERWADFVDTGAHKEAEPYKRPVVLSRGAMLDVTEISSVIRKQK